MSLMLDGVSDTSGAILLFAVRPFAEKFQTRYRYYKLRLPSIADARPRGWGSIFMGVSRTGQGMAEVKNHANRRISPRNGGLVREIIRGGAGQNSTIPQDSENPSFDLDSSARC